MGNPNNTTRSKLILLIEDDENHAELIRRALPIGWELEHLEHASDAVGWLTSACKGTNGHPVPDLIILDWRFQNQEMQGRDVLAALKTEAKQMAMNLHRLPVVVLTTSDEDRDIKDAFGFYANSYLTKPRPGRIEDWARLLAEVVDYWDRLDLHGAAKPQPAVKP